MQMIDRLPAVPAAVHDNAITAVELQLLREVADHQPKMADQLGILIGDRGQRGDRLFRNYEDVRRRLWRNIVKRKATIIFVRDLRRDLFVDDALENGFVGHGLRTSSKLCSTPLVRAWEHRHE